MSLITASNAIQTNSIDTISGTTTLTIGGTNATAISLSEPVTATGTLNVTGLLSANNVGGLKTNKIDPLLSTNDIVIGSGLGVSNSVYIGKTSGGKGVNFPSGLLTNTIQSIGTTSDMVIGANIDPHQQISIGKSTGGGYGVVFPSGIGSIIGLDAISVKINSNATLPLQVNYIEPLVTSTDLTIGNTVVGSLTIGGLATGDVYVGGDANGVNICSNLIIRNNQPTDENVFIDTIYATSASLNIGTQATFPPSAINIGQTGVTTTIDGTANCPNLTVKSLISSIVTISTQTFTPTIASFTTDGTTFVSTYSSANPSIANDIITVNLPVPTSAIEGMIFHFRKIRGAINVSSTNWSFVTSPASIIKSDVTITTSGNPTTTYTVNSLYVRIQVYSYSGVYYWVFL
jgi:hypothetical protein